MDVQADLRRLGLGPTVRLVAALRDLSLGCGSVEDFAQRVCSFLHGSLVDPDGTPQTCLVRFYGTGPLGDLPAQEEDFAVRAFGGPVPPTATCLTLLGTAGVEPAWNDRTASLAHRVLPLVDAGHVGSMPMVAALLDQLGIDLHALLHARPDVVLPHDDPHYRVFHVPSAVGSPVIPAQDFVAAYGVVSALGFGGALPTGEIYAVVIFSRVPVPVETAQLFGTVALSTSVAALDMLHLPLFAAQQGSTRTAARALAAGSGPAAREQLVRALLAVYERMAANEADRAAVALDQARYDASRAAALAAVALRMTGVATVAEVTQVIVRDALPVLRADSGAIALVDDEGDELTVLSSDGDGVSAGYTYQRMPLDDSLPIVWAAHRGEQVLIPDLAAGLDRFPALAAVHRQVGAQAVAAFPLVVDHRLFGALTLTWHSPQTFSAAALELMQALAAQTAQALDRARLLEQERRQSEVLQRSFLTRPSPPDGLELAVRYRPAAEHAQVGGDWYDAFSGNDGATMVAVGDVVGHDLLAAAVMGQLRNVLRGIAFARPGDPATTLDLLEAAVAGLEIGAFATVILARIEPCAHGPGAGSRRVTWSNAGHPPPLLRRPDGQVTVLDTEPDLMIGVDAGQQRHQHVAVLDPGATLVLYTDGLTERRAEHVEVGIHRLRDLVAEVGHLPVEALCDLVLQRMLPTVGAEDDVALLVVRLREMSY